MKQQRAAAAACPCGGGAYPLCCGRFHQGDIPASAEQLMRSRYSAYVLGLHDYLRATWHPRTRPAEQDLQGDDARWLGLEVRSAQEHGDEATVEFIARYRLAGRGHRLHETSRFLREDGRWFYLDGSFPEGRS
nr:YchJ family metal-binding protein [uncultured Noviherbaspirillum sp.]